MPVDQGAASSQSQADTESAVEESSSNRQQIPQSEDTEDGRPCFWRYITAITRIWSILTIAALWYCTVDMIQHRDDYEYTHWYTLAVSIVITFLEAVWLLNKCACCKDDGNCCCACWRIIRWIDNWKKGILYACLAIPDFTKGIVAFMAVICGLLILVLGCFYFLKSFKYSQCVEKNRHKPRTRYVETESPKARLVSSQVQIEPTESRSASSNNGGYDAMATPPAPSQPSVPQAGPQSPPGEQAPATQNDAT